MTAHPPWHKGHLVAFDTETTGIDVHVDRIITTAIVYLAPDQRPRTLSWLIDPGVPVPDEAAEVHGWTTDRLTSTLAGRQALRTVNGTTRPLSRTQAFFEIAGHTALAISQGVPLVAFNAAYDLTILEAECARHDVPTLTERLAPRGVRGVVDPFVIDKHYSRRKGSRKLVDQVAHYGVIVAGAHDAGADALAAARLIPRMVKAYPELARLTLPRLHTMQVEWRKSQQASLKAYFDRVGKPHDDCDGSWPLIPARERVAA